MKIKQQNFSLRASVDVWHEMKSAPKPVYLETLSLSQRVCLAAKKETPPSSEIKQQN